MQAHRIPLQGWEDAAHGGAALLLVHGYARGMVLGWPAAAWGPKRPEHAHVQGGLHQPGPGQAAPHGAAHVPGAVTWWARFMLFAIRQVLSYPGALLGYRWSHRNGQS